MEQTPLDALAEKQKVALAIERMQSLAKAVVDEFEINFKPDKKWEFSQKDKVMKFIPDDLAKMTDREVAATMLHNLGHALYTTMPTLKKCPEPKRQFFQLMNAVEDIRAEEQMMQGLPGTFDSFRYKFKKQDAGISAKVEEKLQPHTQYLYSLQKMFWGQDVSKIDPKVLSALQESEEILFDAYNAESTQEMVDIIADRLWHIFEDLIPPPDKDKKDEDDEKQTLSDIAGQAISMESIVDAMKELSDGKTPGEEGEKEGFGQDVDAEMDAEQAPKSGTAEGKGQYGQTDPVLGRSTPDHHEEPSRARDNYSSYEQLYKEVLPMIPFFRKKLSSIMKDNRYNRNGGTYRSGKLNTKKLYRFTAGSDRIFSRKIMRRHKDYAVSLLVDMSGSMTCNEKNRNAAKATVLLAEVLNQVGIPFEIRGFNEYFYLYKKADEKFSWKHRRNIENIITESYGRGAGCNNDGFAVNQAAHRISQYGDLDTERILIVLSDGLPADSGGTVPKEDQKRLPASKKEFYDFDLKFEVAQAEKKMTVVGIGINAHHVSEYYPQNVICDNVSQLPRMVLGRLKKNIRRG